MLCYTIQKLGVGKWSNQRLLWCLLYGEGLRESSSIVCVASSGCAGNVGNGRFRHEFAAVDWLVEGVIGSTTS